MLNYEEKLSQVSVLISEHNTVCEASKLPTIDCNKFINLIKASGGTTTERLNKDVKHELIEQHLKNSLIEDPNNPSTCYITPTLLITDIAAIFRDYANRKETVKTEDKSHINRKAANRMTDRELIENLSLEDYESHVAKRLSEKSHGEPFVVLKEESGSQIDVDITLKLLNEIKQGHTGRDSYKLPNGKWVEVYKIGEMPDIYVDENPLFYDRPLRPDGTCDQLNASWEGASKVIRQFIRIAIETGCLRVNSSDGFDRARDAMLIAIQPDQEAAMKQLKNRYPDAAKEYDRREKIQDLPKLLVPIRMGLNGKKDSSKKFPEGKPVLWFSPLHCPQTWQVQTYRSKNRF